MATMDPFAGAAAEGQDQKRQLLDIIASSGSAGEKAFKDAQAQVAATRQEALNRADQRAALTGQNLGGADTQRVGETADRFTNYGANQNQAFQQNLQNIGASGQSYLDKVGAIAPFMQSQNMNKAAERENTYKVAIAQAQAAAEAAAQKIKEQQMFELQKLGISESGQNNRTLANISARQAAADRAAQNNITLPQLVGAANAQGQTVAGKINNDTGNILGNAVGGENIKAAQLAQQAGQIGSASGVAGNKLYGLTDPGFLNGLAGDIRKGNPAAPANPVDALKGLREGNPQQYMSLVPQIAAATKVNGGEPIVSEIMSDPKVQTNLNAYYNQAYNGLTSGKKTTYFTWPDILANLKDEYIDHPSKTGHSVPQDRTYSVMVELLRNLPWKRS